MSIDYKQLQELVREAMFTGGGINEPSAPVGVPHRMPASDTGDKEPEQGDAEANKKYAVALAAREATEKLVEALDDPLYDTPYEYAFKASAALRRVLNSLEFDLGAHPMPMQRVVAKPADQQKYTAGSNAGDIAGGAGGMGNFAMGGGVGVGMQEVAGEEELPLAVQEAIKAYEDLDEEEQPLFKAYIQGDVVKREEL